MPNICGGDQHHPSYSSDTKLSKNQVLIDNDLYTILDKNKIEKENVNGHTEKLTYNECPKKVQNKIDKLKKKKEDKNKKQSFSDWLKSF